MSDDYRNDVNASNYAGVPEQDQQPGGGQHPQYGDSSQSRNASNQQGNVYQSGNASNPPQQGAHGNQQYANPGWQPQRPGGQYPNQAQYSQPGQYFQQGQYATPPYGDPAWQPQQPGGGQNPRQSRCGQQGQFGNPQYANSRWQPQDQTGYAQPPQFGAATPSGAFNRHGYQPQNQMVPYQGGYPMQAPKSKLTAALLAFFLGMFGVHNFYLGNTSRGIIQLAMFGVGFVLSFFAIGAVILAGLWVWVVIEFVMILAGSGSYAQDANGNFLV